MVARVFISYRSVDGADKATALSRDLDALFGGEQIFLDKQDLAGGSRWRDVITQTLRAQPVLLVLITPLYLEARDADGRRRIERADDPVRGELTAAIGASAHVIPVLCDGVDEVPNVSVLPSPLNELGERTWRRLRAYDWRADVERLAGDLRQLGLVPTPGGTSPAPAPTPTPASAGPPGARRLLLAAGASALLTAAAGSGAWWWWSQREPATLAGLWTAALGARGAAAPPDWRDGQRFQFRISQQGDQVRLVSTPIEIAQDPAWTDYRAFWQAQKGQDLRRILYRADGVLRLDPGQPGVLEAPLRVEAVTSGEPVDGGHLSATVGERGRRMRGTLWLNSEQADRWIELRRDGSR